VADENKIVYSESQDSHISWTCRTALRMARVGKREIAPHDGPHNESLATTSPWFTGCGLPEFLPLPPFAGPASAPSREDQPTLYPVAAILCTGGADVIRKEEWSSYRKKSGVRLCWELEESKGPKADVERSWHI